MYIYIYYHIIFYCLFVIFIGMPGMGPRARLPEPGSGTVTGLGIPRLAPAPETILHCYPCADHWRRVFA